MRWTNAFIVFFASVFSPWSSSAADIAGQCEAGFRRAAAELAPLEKAESPAPIAAEIGRARLWIRDGRGLLSAGQAERAAVIAERLPFQLVLIRALVGATNAEAEAARTELQSEEIKNAISAMRQRADRLTLKLKASADRSAAGAP